MPDTKVWETSFFTITAHGYASVKVFLWLAIERVMLIITFSIVFILVPKPWHHAWLSFVFMNIFRLGGVLNDNYSWMDEWDIVATIPFSIAAAIILYILKSKLQTHLEILYLKKDIDGALKLFNDENPV